MDGRYGFSRVLDEKSALTFHRMLHLPLIILVLAHSVPAVYLAMQRWGWIKPPRRAVSEKSEVRSPKTERRPRGSKSEGRRVRPCRGAPPLGSGRRALRASPGRRRSSISSPNGATREAPADIFKGDAPKGELWELWRKRGWVKEASHYLKLGRNVQCKVCPNNCLLSPGDRSHCRNKVNYDGTLYTLVYANPCTFHVDPVEKKPLFHFLPGSRTFSLATSGCVFRCLNCQNWEISQKKPEETKDPRGEELRRAPARAVRLHPRPNGPPEPLPGGRRRRRRGPAAAPRFPIPTPSRPPFTNTPSTPAKRRASASSRTSSSVAARSRTARRATSTSSWTPRTWTSKASTRTSTPSSTPASSSPSSTLLKTLKELGVWFEIINLVVPTYTDNLGHHPPDVRLDRQGAGPGPAAALLALPSRSTSWSTSRRRPSRRW